MDDLNVGFDISMISQLWIDYRFYYYTDLSNGILIVRWLFKYREYFGGYWRFNQSLRSIDWWWLGKLWEGCWL